MYHSEPSPGALASPEVAQMWHSQAPPGERMNAVDQRAPRAALYARVSTLNHGQDTGLQLDELRLVAAQRGWEVVEVYDGSGVSGSKTSRPAPDRLLEAARTGKVDLVAVWKLDRLARSVAHLLDLAASLQGWGVGLVSLRDAHVDTTTPAGRFTFQILAAVSELERSLIRERVIAGVRRAQAKGKHCGRPRKATSDKAIVAAQALLSQGWSWRLIAEATGIQRDTLRRRLKESDGVPRAG